MTESSINKVLRNHTTILTRIADRNFCIRNKISDQMTFLNNRKPKNSTLVQARPQIVDVYAIIPNPDPVNMTINTP